jgi:hypothetical protein
MHVSSFDQKPREFIAHCSHKALCATHALQKELLPVVDGQGGDRSWFTGLLSSLPDTDTGEPIQKEEFMQRWSGDCLTLLKHLFKKHEGEVVELAGSWSSKAEHIVQEPLPDLLVHPQFAKDWRAYQKGIHIQGRGRGNLVGTVIPASALQRKGKDTQPAFGGKGGKKGGEAPKGDGKPTQPACGGGKGQPYVADNRVVAKIDGVLHTRVATVTTLPQLMMHLGKWYSAANIYQYYMSLNLLAVKRPHAWTNPVRQAAALMRHHETGYYGFGRS